MDFLLTVMGLNCEQPSFLYTRRYYQWHRNRSDILSPSPGLVMPSPGAEGYVLPACFEGWKTSMRIFG